MNLARRHLVPLCISAILALYVRSASGALSGGCTHDIDCDDGLPCTADYCDFPSQGPVGSGICQHEPVPDGQSGGEGGTDCASKFGILCGGCDDGLFCNGVETCQSGACAPGTPPCSGGQVCSESLNLCQPGPCSETKVCVGGPTPGAVCTGTNECGIGGLCRYAECHDGLHCNGEEICVAGVCQAGENPCGFGAICGERQCSEGAQIDICLTDEDCMLVGTGWGGTCSFVGPVCVWGRCCVGTVEPTCTRRRPKGQCQGDSPGSNALAACLSNSDCDLGLCQQFTGSCAGIGGAFFPGDLGTIPQGGGLACPVINSVQSRCPKYGSGISPHGTLTSPTGPISESNAPNLVAGIAIRKLGDDYALSNSGLCDGGERDGLPCTTVNECPGGGECSPSNTVLAVSYLRISGGQVGYTRLVVEFYDAMENLVARFYDGNANFTGVERFFFDPPIVVPSRGYVVLQVGAEYSPEGRFFWSATDAVDIGGNDPDVLWINDGPVANFLAPNPGILAFELEGENVATPLGACCDSDGDCMDGLLPWICEGDGGQFQGPGTTCPIPACDTGACCDPATGQCSVGTESDCTNAGGDFQGYGTDCDVDDGHDAADQHCCPQPFTAADRCEDAIVHMITVPPPGSDPVVVTISGDNTPAIWQTNDYCCADDCAIDFGWWEAFEIDAYAYVRIDYCCSEPLRRQFHRGLFDCPCGQAIMSSANPFDFPEPAYALGDPYCDDGNPWVNFGPLPPGRYYYPVFSVREGILGPYQLHITVEPLPTAACCVADQCTGGVNQIECDNLGGIYLGPPIHAPLVPDCSTSPCATGSCCNGPGQCFDTFLGQPATITDCANVQATYLGGIRCNGGICEDNPQLSCGDNADCPGDDICLGSPQQLAQPSPCPICSIEAANNCQPFEDILNFAISDRSLGSGGLLSADDFRPEGTVLDRVCVWGFYVDVDPNASDSYCATTSSDDRFRVRVFSTNPSTGRSPGTLVGESLVSSTRGEIPGTLIYSRLQVPVYGFELALADPIMGLSPGEIYWIEISNDVSEAHPTCVWFWSQRSSSALTFSFNGNEDSYPVHHATPFDNAFCLNFGFSPMSPDLLVAACCTCDEQCTSQTLYDCADINGIWDITHSNCEWVTCPESPPPNDNCVDGPQPITAGSYTVSNQCATTDGYGPIGEWPPFQVDFDLWYHFIAPASCDLVISECQTGLNFDSGLAVYANCPSGPVNGCDPTICPPCPFDAVTSASHLAGIPQDESCLGVAMGGAGYWRASEQILRNALPDECFLIRAGSFPGSRGTAILDITCPGFPIEPPGPVLVQSNGSCGAPGIPYPCCTGAGTGICDKTRFISFTPPKDSVEEVALRVKLTSLHHVNPPYTAGPSVPFTAFEGLALYVGPPEDYVESSANPTLFKSAELQCQPYYHDWSAVGLIHVRGSAIVPSSTYHIELLAEACMGNEGSAQCQFGGSLVSPPVPINTTRWADIELPFNPPSASIQPDLADVAALVNKFRNQPGAPAKAWALLAGTDAFGTLDPSGDLNFTHISVAVDAFRGRPYPYQIQVCP